MSFYADIILPHVIDLTCGMKAFEPERQATVASLEGTVLEIGFGSGLNLPHLPPAVTTLLAVDPSERARKIARKRIEAARCEVRTVGLDAETIDAPDASADHALCTFTLCTIPDPVRALSEVKRILRPGGRLHVLEHGRAPDAGVARWQERLNGMQRVIGGGCNLNRDIVGLLSAAGFTLESVDAKYFPGTPRTHGYLVRASAVS